MCRLIHTFVPHIGLLVTRMLFCSTNGPINKEQNFATSFIAKANLGAYTIYDAHMTHPTWLDFAA